MKKILSIIISICVITSLSFAQTKKQQSLTNSEKKLMVDILVYCADAQYNSDEECANKALFLQREFIKNLKTMNKNEYEGLKIFMKACYNVCIQPDLLPFYIDNIYK